MNCKYCGSDNIEFFDCGYSKVGRKKIFWEAYRCADCNEITSDEPQEEWL